MKTSSQGYLTMTPTLDNNRLVLKAISQSDVPSIIEISVYDGVFATSEAQANDILQKIHGDVASGESIHWGIFLKDTNELVGTIGYYRGFAQKCGEIGYLLKPTYRGRGIMGEAVNLVVAYGFDGLKLDTVVGFTSAENLPSIAVLQNAGFTQVSSDQSDLKFELYSD